MENRAERKGSEAAADGLDAGFCNPHKHRDFHQKIPVAAWENCENIPSTEEQSSREESRKRPS
jgi:hypothetical protein